LPVSALVDDLEALRLALGVPRWAVLGGSWGAYLALAYLRRYPAAVTRLVLRGSFLARSADVWNLLRAMPAAALRAAGLPAPAQRGQWSAWLHRAQRLLRFATAHPARLPLTQIWLLAEYRCAVRGAGRAWRHAVQPEPPTVADDRRFVPAAAHLHTAWRKLRQGQRQAEVALRTRRAVPQAQQRKVLLQARWLARGCDHALHGALPTWRAWLAQAAQQSSGLAVGVEAAAHAVPPLLWLHGRFDAVCQPRNALRLQAMLADPAWPQAVQGRWVHGGHLATEPAMAQALRQVLRGPSC
jgi:proline iminopeptidase